MESNRRNLDRATVKDFGREWQRFDQSGMSLALQIFMCTQLAVVSTSRTQWMVRFVQPAWKRRFLRKYYLGLRFRNL